MLQFQYRSSIIYNGEDELLFQEFYLTPPVEAPPTLKPNEAVDETFCASNYVDRQIAENQTANGPT